jgi:hypothetical protein
MSYDAPPPPPPQQGGYGQPGGWQGPPQDHPRATTILILGIVSLVCCGPLGIVAWIMGNTAQREIAESGGRLGGAGMVKAGKICGIIAVVLMVIAVVFYGIVFATGDWDATFND